MRVINSESAPATSYRMVIESQDEDDVWGTVGVSENIIEASWIALVDSFEYKLCKDEEKLAAQNASQNAAQRCQSALHSKDGPTRPAEKQADQ